MAVFQEQDSGCCRFEIRPNCALSWRWTKYLIAFFACCFAGVGGYFASLGAWLVLPFAGVEFMVLMAGLYISSLAGHTREVIEIRERELRLLRGGRRLREVACLKRHFTKVLLVRDPRGWHPSRLFLRRHGRSVEIRTRLVEAERVQLADALLECLDAPLPAGAAALPMPSPVREGIPAQQSHGGAVLGDPGLRGGELTAGAGWPLLREGSEVSSCAAGANSRD